MLIFTITLYVAILIPILQIKKLSLREKSNDLLYIGRDFPAGAVDRNPLASAGDIRDGFDPWVGKIHWRKWHLGNPMDSTLAGYSLFQFSTVA